MIRQSTPAMPEMPGQRHQTAIPWSTQRPAAGDVEYSCSIAQCVVAIAFGQPERRLDSGGTAGRRSAFARQIAMYLAHVGFGLSMAQIGKAFGRDRTTVVHACHVIEDRRDEDRFDAVLDHLEQAAAALLAASRLNR